MSIQSVAITGVWLPSSYADPFEAALQAKSDAIETPATDEAFEADIDCTDCGHRQHIGECVAGIYTVCGCDHPSWPPLEDGCCDQPFCPTSPAFDPNCFPASYHPPMEPGDGL